MKGVSKVNEELLFAKFQITRTRRLKLTGGRFKKNPKEILFSYTAHSECIKLLAAGGYGGKYYSQNQIGIRQIHGGRVP